MTKFTNELQHFNDEQLKAFIQQHEEHFIQEILKGIEAQQMIIREECMILFKRCNALHLLTPYCIQSLYDALLTKDYLYYTNLEDSNAVFKRVTSAFILIELMHNPQFNLDLSFVSKYLSIERDGRGYISKEQGWADAIGTSVELCSIATTKPNFQVSTGVAILQAIKKSIWQSKPYSNNEDERIAKTIIKLLYKEVPEELIIEWVEQLFDKLQVYSFEHGYTPEWFEARTNTMLVTKSLYFYLKYSKQWKELLAVVSTLIPRYIL